MKIIMYGTELCPDCVSAKAKLASFANIELEFKDITKSLKILKDFLYYRDHDEIFDPIIKADGIGIPLFILEDQTRTFELNDFINLGESV